MTKSVRVIRQLQSGKSISCGIGEAQPSLLIALTFLRPNHHTDRTILQLLIKTQIQCSILITAHGKQWNHGVVFHHHGQISFRTSLKAYNPSRLVIMILIGIANLHVPHNRIMVDCRLIIAIIAADDLDTYASPCISSNLNRSPVRRTYKAQLTPSRFIKGEHLLHRCIQFQLSPSGSVEIFNRNFTNKYFRSCTARILLWFLLNYL